MKLIVIEGGDGTGTTTHADTLAVALCRGGYAALAYHHPPHPPGCTHWERSLHYALARAKVCSKLRETDTVLVADRWYHSTWAYTAALTGEPVRVSMLGLSLYEDSILPPITLAVMLDAPDEVLDARLRARGRDPTADERVIRNGYRGYLAGSMDAIVDTAAPCEAVGARLLELSLAALRA